MDLMLGFYIPRFMGPMGRPVLRAMMDPPLLKAMDFKPHCASLLAWLLGLRARRWGLSWLPKRKRPHLSRASHVPLIPLATGLTNWARFSLPRPSTIEQWLEPGPIQPNKAEASKDRRENDDNGSGVHGDSFYVSVPRHISAPVSLNSPFSPERALNLGNMAEVAACTIFILDKAAVELGCSGPKRRVRVCTFGGLLA